jgi:PAS domain S-box-containing protein
VRTAQALLNASPDLMILLDTSGTILALNKAAAERLGKNVKNLLGTCVFDHLPKKAARRRRMYFEQTISSDEPVRFKDENQGRLITLCMYPVHDAHGKVSKIAVYARE